MKEALSRKAAMAEAKFIGWNRAGELHRERRFRREQIAARRDRAIGTFGHARAHRRVGSDARGRSAQEIMLERVGDVRMAASGERERNEEWLQKAFHNQARIVAPQAIPCPPSRARMKRRSRRAD